ncbi:hypothetical protein BX600DRAFT_85510 [Xylariales sp. PMI_506]|nr:hypothetical protein BX600DRAFT_85510 [Xylariales sp. PMI_506]
MAHYDVTAELLYELMRLLHVPLHYADMMSKLKINASAPWGFSQSVQLLQNDTYPPLRKAPRIMEAQRPTDMLYYSLFTSEEPPSFDVRLVSGARGHRIGAVAVYHHQRYRDHGPVWFLASTRRSQYLKLFQSWMEKARQTPDEANLHESDLFQLFLCEISCMNWSSALTNQEREIFQINDLKMISYRDEDDRPRDSILRIRSIENYLEAVTSCIEHNLAVMQWLLATLESGPRSTYAFDFGQNSVLIMTRIEEVIQEHEMHLKWGAQLLKRLQKLKEFTKLLDNDTQAKKLQWTVLQVLKISFMMRTYVSVMGTILIILLPGIFVSTLFATEFFEYSAGSISVSSNFWIWFATVLPLTMAIFLLQMAWYLFSSGTAPDWLELLRWGAKKRTRGDGAVEMTTVK